MKKLVTRGAFPALLFALALAAPPHLARAQSPAPGIAEGPRKVIEYSSCAAGLAASQTFPQAMAAIGNCIRLALAEIG